MNEQFHCHSKYDNSLNLIYVKQTAYSIWMFDLSFFFFILFLELLGGFLDVFSTFWICVSNGGFTTAFSSWILVYSQL